MPSSNDSGTNGNRGTRSRCGPQRGRPWNWSEVTWLPCLRLSWMTLAMTSAWSRATPAGGELLGDGEPVEHAGSLPRAPRSCPEQEIPAAQGLEPTWGALQDDCRTRAPRASRSRLGMRSGATKWLRSAFPDHEPRPLGLLRRRGVSTARGGALPRNNSSASDRFRRISSPAGRGPLYPSWPGRPYLDESWRPGRPPSDGPAGSASSPRR